MGNKLTIVFAICVLILIDIFARFIYNLNWFSNINLSTSIDPFDIISLIISSLVTILVGYHISKAFTEQRYIKEFLIKDLIGLEKEIEQIEQRIDSTNIEIGQSIDSLNSIQNKISRFTNSISLCKKKKLFLNNLQEPFSQLYKFLTDCDSETLVVTEENKHSIQMLVDNFISSVRLQIIHINNK